MYGDFLKEDTVKSQLICCYTYNKYVFQNVKSNKVW